MFTDVEPMFYPRNPRRRRQQKLEPGAYYVHQEQEGLGPQFSSDDWYGSPAEALAVYRDLVQEAKDGLTPESRQQTRISLHRAAADAPGVPEDDPILDWARQRNPVFWATTKKEAEGITRDLRAQRTLMTHEPVYQVELRTLRSGRPGLYEIHTNAPHAAVEQVGRKYRNPGLIDAARYVRQAQTAVAKDDWDAYIDRLATAGIFAEAASERLPAKSAPARSLAAAVKALHRGADATSQRAAGLALEEANANVRVAARQLQGYAENPRQERPMRRRRNPDTLFTVALVAAALLAGIYLEHYGAVARVLPDTWEPKLFPPAPAPSGTTT